ncbi:MAG: hemerythrin domain-containing protein [Acidimicrobiia bacterium]
MTNESSLDMTMMLAYHDALRRDLKQIARMEQRSDGWDLFETLLHVHHTAEDDALWPVVREAVAGQADDLALLDEMEAEHAALGPLLEAIDEGLERGDSAPQARAEMATKLQEHLSHEEDAALPLIDATMTVEQWMGFGQAATERLGPNMPKYLPWLLDGADEDTTARVLTLIPPPVQEMYRNEWRPAYAAKDWWSA